MALTKRNVDVVLVSRGDPQENRRFVEERGLRCRILLQPEGNGGIAAFAGIGTPAAYLIDEHGRVAKPMALGADEVPSLVREAAGRQLKLSTERPLSESRIQRDGLPAGTPAPFLLVAFGVWREDLPRAVPRERDVGGLQRSRLRSLRGPRR